MKQSSCFLIAAPLLLAAGCAHNNSPITMAPPMTPVTISQPSANYAGQNQVYNWTEVPVGQQVPIQGAVFDQGGYQLYSQEGTIVVPFVNQNLYVMKFGQSSSGDMYFISNGQYPTLYLPANGSLENAAQPGAQWYPFPQNYAYTQPVYVGLAPSWSAFTGMGWYPGMSYYGGYWGYHPYSAFGPMIGLHFLIGGSPYYGWNSYHSYYDSHPYGRSATRVVNRTVYNQSARTSFNSGYSSNSGFSSRRSFGSAGTTFGSRSTGSFGSGGSSGFGSAAPRSTSSGGSFGRGPSGFGGSFGTGRHSFPAGSSTFGGGTFGGGSMGGGSMGGGSSAPRTSFGGGFFGGSRSSSGGGSFGGGRSSFGGGFGRHH